MKDAALRIHSWMERNLQEPFLKAEMTRAEESLKHCSTFSKGIKFTTAAGLFVAVCWMVASAVR